MNTQGSKYRIKTIRAVHNLRMDHISTQNLLPFFVLFSYLILLCVELGPLSMNKNVFTSQWT